MTYRDSNAADAPADHTGIAEEDILSASGSEPIPGQEIAAVEPAARAILWSATAHAFAAVAAAGHGLALAELIFAYTPPPLLADEHATIEDVPATTAGPVDAGSVAEETIVFEPIEPVADEAEVLDTPAFASNEVIAIGYEAESAALDVIDTAPVEAEAEVLETLTFAPVEPESEIEAEVVAEDALVSNTVETVAAEAEVLETLTFAPVEPEAEFEAVVVADSAIVSAPVEAAADAIEIATSSVSTEPGLEAAPADAFESDLIAAASPEAIQAGDDLTLIRGIDEKAAAILHSFGIVRFRDIAAFQAEDARIVSQALADERRLSRECWIEQAALLAKGVMTSYARTRLADSGEPAVVLAFPAPDAESNATDTAAAATEAATDGTAGSEPAAEAVQETAPVAAADTATAEASNVIAFPQMPKPKRSHGNARRWAAVAASLAVMAAVTASTFGIRPAFAQYFEGFGCGTAMIGISTACEQLSWLTD